MSPSKKTLALAVGGTRGHILPAKALYEELKANYSVLFIGVGLQRASDLEANEYPVFPIAGSNRNPIKILKGIYESQRLLRAHKVQHVVGFGSFHSLPPLLAAMLCRIPFSLYEPNTLLGRVNQILSPFAKKVGVCFPHKFHKKAQHVSPLYERVSKETIEQEAAKAHWGFDPEKPVLLVVGGSQGATYINQMVLEASLFCNTSLQILHIAGYSEDVGRLKAQYKLQGRKAHVVEYTKELPKGYIAADVVISRAGAGALHNQIQHAKPVIYIPYPRGVRDHQVHNARYMTDHVKGAYTMIQDAITPKKLADCIYNCLIDRHIYHEALSTYAETKAAISVGQLIQDLL